MAYKREIRTDDVTEKLLIALREGSVSEGDLKKAERAIEEYEKVGPIIRRKDLCKREHGFWECPSCNRIPHKEPSSDHDVCPCCGYKLTKEEVEAQKERMARVKKVY